MSQELNILIVDDQPSMVKTLADILTAKGYRAETASSAAEALQKVKAGDFGCVLTDIKMPEMNGVELTRAVRALQPDLPVVLMTAYSTDRLVEEGLQESAVAVLTKPLDINALLSFFSALRDEQCIAIVDDDPHFCRTLGDILRVQGFAVTEIADPSGLPDRLLADGQVMLLDMKLENTTGLEVLRQIRAKHPHLPVIMVTGYRQEMLPAVEAALEISAYTCLYKPLDIEELLRVLAEVHKQELGRILGRPVRKGTGR